ncbi:hypothetical protein [Fodinibius halophilus]|uniref:Uncharacterized protein n=1 Tax=Fodinibius halophilus TaxID=1736908 RepID=A0A6M1T5N6_9BACT|nr:hypothetical protein [Fodinibius halophilus]NGP88585.1 hypothetical protein [Fodinibius halophilus]
MNSIVRELGELVGALNESDRQWAKGANGNDYPKNKAESKFGSNPMSEQQKVNSSQNSKENGRDLITFDGDADFSGF